MTSSSGSFSMRIVNVDYYMAPPLLDMDECYSHFFGHSVMEVPVVRMYGSTIAGQKTCLHIHKAFPYFYVPYDAELPQEVDEALAYIRRLAFSLEKSMKASIIGARRQHVHSCSLVRARKFYGYHPFDELFIKIALYHPQEVSKMSSLLLGGAILGHKFQPHEAHIPYLLQILVDYNLSGMGHINLSKLRFRNPLPNFPKQRKGLVNRIFDENTFNGFASQESKHEECSKDEKLWLASNIPSEFVWSNPEEGSDQMNVPTRASTCELEADTTVEEILNSSTLFFIPLRDAKSEVKMVQSLMPIWEEDSISANSKETFRDALAVPTHLQAFQKEILQSLCRPVGAEDTCVSLIESTQPANVRQASENSTPAVWEGAPEDATEILTAHGTKSVDVDNEAIELLRWMVASQHNEDGGAEQETEEECAEAELCRTSECAGGVQGALQKSLSAYELLSQRECQDILDCAEENLERERGYHENIPQVDGSCDESSKLSFPENVRPSKKSRQQSWGALPLAAVPPEKKVKDESCSEEVMSVRDLMRFKRERKKGSGVKRESENSGKGGDAASSSSSGTIMRKSFQSVEPQYGSLPLVSNNYLKRESHDDVFEDCPHNSTALPVTALAEESNTELALTFHTKPPKREHLLATFENHGLNPVDYGGAYYSVSKDVDKSIYSNLDATKLIDVGVATEGKSDSKGKDYVEKEYWDSGTADGMPIHFENDGSKLYLLTPCKSPPSLSSVAQWMRLQRKNPVKVEVKPIPSSTELQRPASPKYDEKHVFPVTPVTGSTSSATPSKETPVASTGKRLSFSQLTAASHELTPPSQLGFRDAVAASAGSNSQQITLMSIEMLAESRGNFRPDPRYDAISCIAVVIQDDEDVRKEAVVLLVDKQYNRNVDGLTGCELRYFQSELSLLQTFIKLVHAYDPDMILGWEIQRVSIGYLAERAAILGIGLLAQLSRTPTGNAANLNAFFMKKRRDVDEDEDENEDEDEDGGDGDKGNVGYAAAAAEAKEMVVIEDEWGRTHGSGIFVTGRTILNLWRIMRGELKLGSYTIEAVAEAVLKRKTPRVSWRDLNAWFASGAARNRFKALEYVVTRAKLNLEIIDQLDLVNRTAELARIFGIDFFSVFSRGSQYRVESMMLRLAHSQNYLMISPSKEQVSAQPAMECLPLVMEPESKFYSSPVVVLDFQSLYPSMIIAYNLCFSTCLGKCISNNPKVLGVTSLSIQPDVLSKLMDKLTITPNGILFVPPEVIPGVLPRLLQEILSTRIMVKASMKKLLPSQRVRHRVLNARQFALKLISNVTYGYTAAGFSGRMPCAEVADSIVQLGRHTLEHAIHMVNSNPNWRGRVVYGDTDSMFVLLEGRSREEAFRIGEEIASAVTAVNPHPVTLKMEKVYHPCFLLTKKRYVGYSYDSIAQQTPTFDAKGIETVRRDSCGAVSKTLEKSLRIFFESPDISKVKAYVQRQWKKIMSGRISLKDFIFSKEVRLGSYSKRASVLPPAALVASKAMALDPRAEPCYGERVPYVVVHGKPGARLSDMVVDPYNLIDGGSSPNLRLHDTYYINKQIIPSMQRVFGLIGGVDVRLWLSGVPRFYRPKRTSDGGDEDDDDDEVMKGRIDDYFGSKHCAVCGEMMGMMMVMKRDDVCRRCSDLRSLTLVKLGRQNILHTHQQHILSICRHCGGGEKCISLDCDVYFERLKIRGQIRNCRTQLLELF